MMLFVILVIGIAILFFFPTNTNNLKNIIPEDPIEKVVEEVVPPMYLIAIKNLGVDINNYGIVVKNLKTGETFTNSENKTFLSASLYKIWVMAATFQQISNGKMSENEELKGSLDELNVKLEIATQSAEPTPEKKEVTYNLGEAIDVMITVSDNYAALLVASRSGEQSIFNFLKTYGLENSSYKQPPKTTAIDVANLLEKIYKGEVVNKQYSQRMIEILKKQKLNDRIPKYLPTYTEVAHKTGELGYFKHDAGIVFSNKGDYIIVVLSETEDSASSAEKIANFSKDIYEYFNK